MNVLEDPLEPLGVAVGVFLVLVGLATLAGQPWAYKSSTAVMAGQVVGAISAVAIGAGLAWLVYTQK